MKTIDYIALTLVIIGAINWGLIGFFGFDLVAFICGTMSILSRIIYAVVGICGLYAISFCGRLKNYPITGEPTRANPDLHVPRPSQAAPLSQHW